jgi:hypothetical protein
MTIDADLPLGWESADNPSFGNWPDDTTATAAWKQLKQQLPVGSGFTGKVVVRTRFGVFLDAGIGFPVLMEATEFDTPETPAASTPALNTMVSGEVWGFGDRNHQVYAIKIRGKNDLDTAAGYI